MNAIRVAAARATGIDFTRLMDLGRQLGLATGMEQPMHAFLAHIGSDMLAPASFDRDTGWFRAAFHVVCAERWS